jgi:hypothetical protein
MNIPKGTTIYLVSSWELAIFLAAADCKLPHLLTPFPTTMHSHYSGDDPASICNVVTIQMDLLFPSLHLCATDHCFLYFHRYLQQSQHLSLRYVSS